MSHGQAESEFTRLACDLTTKTVLDPVEMVNQPIWAEPLSLAPRPN